MWMVKMRLGFRKDFWDKYQIKAEVNVNPLLNPSLLLTGESGSGKSYALKLLLSDFLRSREGKGAELWFLNYKDSLDFRFLKNYPRYFCGEQCSTGFEAFYERYNKIRANEGEEIKHMTIGCFDEFPAFLLSIQMKDKKLADRYMRNLGEILMTSRSYKCGCWVTNQRADSAYYINGTREQFHSRILLTRGMPSKESLAMLGFTREDLKSESYGVGEGLAYVDGQGMYEIKFPQYNSAKVEERILRCLSCEP